MINLLYIKLKRKKNYELEKTRSEKRTEKIPTAKIKNMADKLSFQKYLDKAHNV